MLPFDNVCAFSNHRAQLISSFVLSPTKHPSNTLGSETRQFMRVLELMDHFAEAMTFGDKDELKKFFYDDKAMAARVGSYYQNRSAKARDHRRAVMRVLFSFFDLQFVGAKLSGASSGRKKAKIDADNK